MNYIKLTLTVIDNIMTGVIHKPPQVMLGRWNRIKKQNSIKSFYANTDHCGDYICGNPDVLKKTYPEYFKIN